MENNQQYVASFTLVQDGLDGEVTPKLDFLPLVDPIQEDAPAIYEYMSTVALNFLRTVNVLDDQLNLIKPDALANVGLNVQTSGRKH